MKKEIIEMTKEELEKLRVINKVEEGILTQREAAKILSISERHFRRLLKKVREEGEEAIVHGNRGKRSNRRYSDEFRQKVMSIIKDSYKDFGPTHATEKLTEDHDIKISKETVRKWMNTKEFRESDGEQKQEEKIYDRRERKRCFGGMVQTDGCIAHWFEDRAPRAVLMAYLDDATSHLFARFYPSENTRAAMDSFKQYIEIYGIPQSLYFDRNSIYKTTRQPGIEEQLKDEMPATQFGKVLNILEVESIFAYTPEAKGRIERYFRTLQERLPKEMRLEGISSIEEGNEFLKSYLPKFNDKFSVSPVKNKNLHRKVPKEMTLDWVFAFRNKRTVSKDLTLQWKTRTFVLEEKSPALKQTKVTVLENLEEEVRIWFNGRFLEFKEITKHSVKALREKRKEDQKDPAERPKQKWEPSENHPWRGKNRALFAESIE